MIYWQTKPFSIKKYKYKILTYLEINCMDFQLFFFMTQFINTAIKFNCMQSNKSVNIHFPFQFK